MSDHNIRSDLLEWMRNSIFIEIKSHSRFPITIDSQLLLFLYKDLINADSSEALNKLLKQIFEFKPDQSAKIYEFIQKRKQLFKDYLASPDSFYDDEEQISVMKTKLSNISKHVVSVSDLIKIMSSSPTYTPIDHQDLISKKYDKNFQNLFTISVSLVESDIPKNRQVSVVSDVLVKYGYINAVFDLNDKIVVQFQGFEPILAIAFHIQQIKATLNCQKAKFSAVFKQKDDILVCVDDSLILKNLPLEYRKDGIFTLEKIDFKYIKNTFVNEIDDQVILQFASNRSRFAFNKFTKLDEIGIEVELIPGQLKLEGLNKMLKVQKADDK